MGFEGLIRPLRRLRRVPPLVVDAGIAAIFVVLVAAEAVRQPVPGGRTALFALLTLVMAASLALRRRWPLAALRDRDCGPRRGVVPARGHRSSHRSPPWSAPTPSAYTLLGPALGGDC